MANTFTQLFTPVVLTASSAVLYSMPTTPAGTILRNGRVRLTNTTALIATATLYADVAATGSSAANACLSAYSVPANGFVDIDIPVLKAGDTLRGLASIISSITVHHIDGFLVTP